MQVFKTVYMQYIHFSGLASHDIKLNPQNSNVFNYG